MYRRIACVLSMSMLGDADAATLAAWIMAGAK
jgi:hypothetical protein